jgi:hypothetical protein
MNIEYNPYMSLAAFMTVLYLSNTLFSCRQQYGSWTNDLHHIDRKNKSCDPPAVRDGPAEEGAQLSCSNPQQEQDESCVDQHGCQLVDYLVMETHFGFC